MTEEPKQSDQILDIARLEWEKDVERTSHYVVRRGNEENTWDMFSDFEADSLALQELDCQPCEICRQPMPCVASLDTRDMPARDISDPLNILVFACQQSTCRSRLNAGLSGPLATYEWGSTPPPASKTRSSVPKKNWLQVSVTSSNENAYRRSTSVYCLKADADRIDPTDYRWYPDDGFASHAQEILSTLEDRVQRRAIYQRLVQDRPRWLDAKFGGYPHWRSITMDGGCEESMRGRLIFTFSHELCPQLCDEGISAWLFVCPSLPEINNRTLIFQQDLNRNQLLGKAGT